MRTQPDELGLKTKRPLYRRHTTSTALQLAVDHTFTGSYVARFRPADPPETLRCPCSSPSRDPTHIILDCPLFTEARLTSSIITPSRTHPPTTLLGRETHPTAPTVFGVY